MGGPSVYLGVLWANSLTALTPEGSVGQEETCVLGTEVRGP